MSGSERLRHIPVQIINRMVMATEDPDVLLQWLEEEKRDGKRRSALSRIHHRFNVLRARREIEELGRIAEQG